MDLTTQITKSGGNRQSSDSVAELDEDVDATYGGESNRAALRKESIRWRRSGSLATKNNQSYGRMLRYGNIIIHSSGIVTGPPLPFIYVPITYRYDGNDKRFLLESDQEFLVRIPWMVLSGDNYFVPALFLNRMLEPELSRLFPDKETVFHHLSRTFNKEQSPLDQVVDQVINCTLSEGLLPPVALDRPVVSANLNNSKVVLITTLHSQFSDRTRNMYCEHPSKGGVLVSIHQPSHEEWQQMELENHDLKAWAEIYLLCFADVLVTSAESAFGYIAHGPAGIRPWILKSSYSGRMPEPSCVRDTSIYPCFHSLPWYDCESCKWLSDSGKEISYVTHCRDFPHGIELVGQID
ncbi:unnamed protein product [Spirodela intermedia]|uniref:Fucosyltransferase n=1 Tax=Spirodela intermedia TaxID=51605 RepID=A0A7I8L9D8_SPIIN|nr:unnamed protein product [Spirodela intermedia]